jgi:hypothetical protein
LDNNFICLNNLINTKNGFGGNRWYIPSGETITVESDYQYFFYGDIIVDGLLQLSGNSQLVVLNGDIITTGGTIDGTGSIYNIDLPTFDTKVTGMTYSGDVLTIYQNDGSSYSATVITSTDITITGGTYDPVTGVATFYNNVGGNFPVTGFLTGYTDVQVSDLNYVGQTLVLNQTNGTSFSATTPSYTFTGNTSGDCITDLFVSNVNSCSPLHIQPLNTGDVYIGENGGVNVGIGINSPSAKLHINNTTTGNTIIFEDDTSPDPSPFVIDNGGNVGIGTSTPSEKLEVNNGNIKTNQGVIVDGGTYNGIRFNSSGFSRFAIDGSSKLNANFTEGFKFTNGTYDFFNYDQSGFGDTFQIGNGLIKGRTTGTTDVYLGINVSGTPSSTLHVVGTDSSSSNYGLKVQDSGGTDNFVVRNDGNVGIGTTNPNAKLDVRGTTSSGEVLLQLYSTDWATPSERPRFTLTQGTSLIRANHQNFYASDDNGNVNATFRGDNAIIEMYSPSFSATTFRIANSNKPLIYAPNSGLIGTTSKWLFDPNNSTNPTANVHIKGIDSSSSNYGLKVQDSGGTDNFVVRNDGNVGIGTSSPSETLEVVGKTKTTNLQVTSGATPGYILTSDSIGNATWQLPSGGGTFTGGTVSGSTDFTNGLTANTLVVGTFPVGRKYSSSQSFTGSVLKTITHNLNTQDVIVQLWDSNNNLLNGATITANNVNSVDITVSSTATYKVIIIG